MQGVLGVVGEHGHGGLGDDRPGVDTLVDDVDGHAGELHAVGQRVTDGVVNTDSPISLTLNEVNSAPTIAAISDQTVDELTHLSLTANGTDTDDPANTLTYSLDAGYQSGMTINPATGAISWTPT